MNTRFKCEVCDLNLKNEVEIALHLLECHEVNILTVGNNTVILNTSQIILANRSPYWSCRKGLAEDSPDEETKVFVKSEGDIDLDDPNECDEDYRNSSNSSPFAFESNQGENEQYPQPESDEVMQLVQVKFEEDVEIKKLLEQNPHSNEDDEHGKSSGQNPNPQPHLRKCSLCPSKFSKLSQLKIHEAIHHKISSKGIKIAFPCAKCGYVGDNQADLEIHVGLHHHSQTSPSAESSNSTTIEESPKFLFQCAVPGCPESFLRRYKREKHFLTHSEECREGLQFPCDYPGCPEIFTKNYKREKHFDLHHTSNTHTPGIASNKPMPQTPPAEGQKVVRSSTRRREYKNPEFLFHCPVRRCSLAFDKKYRREEHYLTHTKESREGLQFHCDFPGCPKRFPKRVKRDLHFKSHKIPPKVTYTCDYNSCGRQFSEKAEHDLHFASHTRQNEAEGFFPCSFPGCLDSFRSKALRSRHFNKHSKKAEFKEDKFKCDFPGCWKSFWTLQGMIGHKKHAHSTEDSVVCEFCSVPFINQEELEEHWARTDGKCGVKCPNCFVGFGSKVSLYKHLKVVHGPKENCEVCQKEFPEGTLNAHYENVHHLVNVQGVKIKGEVEGEESEEIKIEVEIDEFILDS